MKTLNRRALVLVVVTAAVATFLYVALSRSRTARDEAATAPASPTAPVNQQLLFRSTALGASYGRLALAPLSRPDAPVTALTLTCDRVHFAGGRGICLSADRGAATTYSAVLFDDEFAARQTLPLDGAPNRTRVSPDGRRGAVTFFAKGESYEAAAVLTRTLLLDMAAGKAIGELERFSISRDGAPLAAAVLGFRGVTFARDGNRFYASLRTRGNPQLVEGDVDARTARVIADDVECPSLSPDGRRIAFLRHLTEPRAVARLHVLNLATGEAIALAETRSVDDQVEWLDDRRVAYALPHGSGSSAIWAAAADGSGEPIMLRADAYSPTVVR
jgi:dipeptidyl aminopeptidase/acylaminoacyl peptidase